MYSTNLARMCACYSMIVNVATLIFVLASLPCYFGFLCVILFVHSCPSSVCVHFCSSCCVCVYWSTWNCVLYVNLSVQRTILCSLVITLAFVSLLLRIVCVVVSNLWFFFFSRGHFCQDSVLTILLPPGAHAHMHTRTHAYTHTHTRCKTPEAIALCNLSCMNVWLYLPLKSKQVTCGLSL